MFAGIFAHFSDVSDLHQFWLESLRTRHQKIRLYQRIFLFQRKKTNKHSLIQLGKTESAT